MKVYVIASTEYRANMPDLFIMDEEGNYYGVSENSYARFYKFPKSIDFWENAICSDSDRYFNIDLVDVDENDVKMFDNLTKDYEKNLAEQPRFGERYPQSENFKTKKAYREAVADYMVRYEKWLKESNIAYYITRCNWLWTERTRLFLSFSEKIKQALKDNECINREW